ncbi:xanthine dehydrogenase family protein molybdopterin-binding subunit [Desertibaculum subflavum]|uniref:xanthine dehydrogenase family protein molybdopterin-binding subunit n=1 Tax=Desertibaculum subflavum TaxID=2268458 RepID=UPI000E669881
MEKFGTAQALRRFEDQRLITGNGRYVDDINLPDQVYGYVVRSPHAHARIKGIDVAAATAVPGVLGVLTAKDLAADGIGPRPCLVPLKNKDGTDRASPVFPVLATEKVRFVGDAVAFVVAETLTEARDAAEQVMVDYAEEPGVADMRDALKPGAPQIHAEAPGNLCFDWHQGDKAKVDEAFAAAKHKVAIEVVNNRVVVASMEARAALASYDATSDRYTLHTNTQGVHSVRRMLAEMVLKVPSEKLRVITPDVGGGFGMKLFLYAEHVLVTYAAKKLGRPVKWTSERAEAFLSDTQGRDNLSQAEIALDADGKILALRVATLANLGAYLSNFAPFIPTMAGSRVLSVQYRMPQIYVEVKGVLTNTVPIDAYRGAGRPEANYLVERLIDKAARVTGIDAVELRRRNFIPPSAMPYATPTGLNYDSGEFAQNLELALKAADRAGFAARKAASKAKGKARGFGIACYLEATAGPTEERAEIKFEADGSVILLVGTQSTGQGHETAYMQLVNEKLGIPYDKIRVVQGDSDLIKSGGGTGGARSLYSEGGALVGAADKVIDKGRQIAGHLLETATADIEFAQGRFRIAGTDRGLSLFDVAQAARDPAKRPAGMEGGLDADEVFKVAGTFPNGCHIAEVEVEPDTGRVQLVGYTVVDDMGRVINPMILEGQAHGGIAQGVGQALIEHTAYDANGQLLSGSFMDYGLPRADDLPDIGFQLNVVPATTNVLGVKGAGEAGTVGAAPAVMNALVDALAEYGVTHVDMPATPEAVWRAIRGAKAA